MYGPPPRRLRARAIFAVLGLIVSMAYTAASTTFAFLGRPVAESADLTLYALTTLFAGIVFIAWLHRARVNLETLAPAALRWRPGWAVGGWLIPLANLVIPVLVVSEVDRVSADRAAAARGRRPSGRAVFVLWAVAWTGYELAGLGVLGDPSQSTFVSALSAVLLAVAGVFAILLVGRITTTQHVAMTLPPPPQPAVAPSPSAQRAVAPPPSRMPHAQQPPAQMPPDAPPPTQPAVDPWPGADY